MFHYCYINLTYFQYWFLIATIHQSECQLRGGRKILCHNVCVCLCVCGSHSLLNPVKERKKEFECGGSGQNGPENEAWEESGGEYVAGGTESNQDS